MVTVRFPSTRLLLAGSCVAAIAAAPLIAIAAAPSAPQPHTLADCPGGVNMNLYQAGTPVGTNCAPVAGGPAAGAPSEGVLTQCSGIPGCLSNALYGPGNVQVPNRDTTVHQSQ